MRKSFVVVSLIVTFGLIAVSFLNLNFLWAFIVVGPLLILGYRDFFQTKQAIRRNFPLFGNFRYLFEAIRPEINQYFVESNSDGVPFSREERSVVYQRAKGVLDTLPFGTQKNVYESGYEWVKHSILAKELKGDSLRIKIGGKDCTQPYSASLFNISAMSFGSLSKNAIEALNAGAKAGNFAHNTGEGGVSPYHLKHGGDLIWQIGTGYFGCRSDEAGFCPERYKKTVSAESIKMIELKLSQGAKPGHGGILPGAKLTEEIANIRGVEQGKDVVSPPSHKEFSTPGGLLKFISQLRELSGGKPVGIKICIGKQHEFFSICKAMVETKNYPDFIAVDGGEGGTGAAPVEFSNHMGAPSVESIVFVDNVLRGFGLREEIKIMASGKVTTAFGMLKVLALGADLVYSARGMMLALGCIQALRCNSNHCPAGVATQDKSLMKGLVVTNKTERVRSYHHETIESLAHILGAMGLSSAEELRPWHIVKRLSPSLVQHYGDLFPRIESGALLKDDVPQAYENAFRRSFVDRF